MSDFLQLGGKTFLVFGVANRKSVAWSVAKSLEEQGAHATRLSEPKVARRVTGHVRVGGFVSGPDSMELGVYAQQVIELKNLPPLWQAAVETEKRWVLAAWSVERPQIAILCRPDSIQSLKNDAGRRLVFAALEWLAVRRT